MEEQIYSKDIPRPVKISWDGYYPYCPNPECGNYDLNENIDKERCHWCGQLLDWINLD